MNWNVGILLATLVTRIHLVKTKAEINLDDVIGMDDVKEQIQRIIFFPLRQRKFLNGLNIQPSKGALLVGPPGTGKTFIARAIAGELGTRFYHKPCSEFVQGVVGEGAKALRDFFEDASREKEEGTVIFLDEIDSIGAKRSESEDTRDLMTQLLTLMDGGLAQKGVFVLAATNRPDVLDEALRRPGRFDYEIYVGPPDQKAREHFINRKREELKFKSDVSFTKLLSKTNGYVIADLEALFKIAINRAVAKVVSKDRNIKDPSKEKIDTEALKGAIESAEIGQEEIDKALKEIVPSTLREGFAVRPSRSWKDIRGQKRLKASLQKYFKDFTKYSSLFSLMKLDLPKGFMLWGPPGTGKTAIAEAIAKQLKFSFMLMNGGEAFGRYVGQAEQYIEKFFSIAKKAEPCIIVIDEIDGIGSRRDQNSADQSYKTGALNALLTNIDSVGTSARILIIGTTNHIDKLDPALIRPGRLERKIFIGITDDDTRKEFLKVDLPNLDWNEKLYKKFLEMTQGFTAAEMVSAIESAKKLALTKSINEAQARKSRLREVLEEDIQTSIKSIKRTVTPEMLKFYEDLRPSYETKLEEEDIIESIPLGVMNVDGMPDQEPNTSKKITQKGKKDVQKKEDKRMNKSVPKSGNDRSSKKDPTKKPKVKKDTK